MELAHLSSVFWAVELTGAFGLAFFLSSGSRWRSFINCILVLYSTLLDIPVNHIYVAKATENNGCQSTDVPLRPFNAELGSHPGVICTHTDVII